MSDGQEDDHAGAGYGPARGRVPPGLHLVSTPIGAARDITLRGLDLLAGADVLAAEDTRSLRRLMEIHGVPLKGRPLIAYHDHNGAQVRPRLIALLAEGKSIAYASEAGTPLVADPGFQLARAAIAAGHSVLAAPGASAVLTALAVGGLPTDRFCFAGFPPAQGAARKAWLAELAPIPATLVCCSIRSEQVRELAAAGEPTFAAVNDLTDLTFIDLPTGHWPMFSRPDDLAELLYREAADA